MANTTDITRLDPQKLVASSPLAWTYLYKFVTENQKPIEFKNHRFLIEPFADLHPDQVIRKSAQVGFSVTAILKSIWLAKYLKLNIIYALPTNDVVKGFVQPKVDTLIASNPLISQMITTDSVSLKNISGRFIHFKGTGSQREAISTSADLLVVDEYDRSIDMNVVNTFDSRLQASDYGWRWRFSNPSSVGFGVDALYEDSDQMHWFVKCQDCGHNWYMDFEPGDKNHYVDKTRAIYACGNCHQELTDRARIRGEWVARFPKRTYRRGYWIHQLMVPWVPASRILEQYNESNIEFFYNFVLGKAYTPTDLVVNRESILRATVPSEVAKTDVVIGVDQDASGQYWVAMTPKGMFAYGKTTSWEELERLKLAWNAKMVMDPAPYPTMPKLLAAKYPDIYLCYFKDSKGLTLLDWRGHLVYADRTRLFDIVAQEIAEAKLLFRMRPQEMEEYIKDWQNLYRTTEENADGRTKSVWKKVENRKSDYSFATAYARIALTLILSSGEMELIDPEPEETPDNVSYEAGKAVSYDEVLGNAIEKTMADFD